MHSGRTYRLSVKSYIAKLLFEVGYKTPVGKQLSPHRCREITYGRKFQQVPEEDSSPALYEKSISSRTTDCCIPDILCQRIK